MKSIELVKEFHKTFGHGVAETVNIDNMQLKELRVALLAEELKELTDALVDENPVAVLDALIDLQYVLDGAFLTFGFHAVKDEAFQEVHNSNMSKLGLDGKPRYRADGKVLKGPNYREPDLQSIVDKIMPTNAENN